MNLIAPKTLIQST